MAVSATSPAPPFAVQQVVPKTTLAQRHARSATGPAAAEAAAPAGGGDPALVYKNAVTSPEELPASRKPRHFVLVKGALLLLSLLCLVAGIASVAFGMYVETKKGLLYPGTRDVPFKISTAAIFLGGFAASVAGALLAIVYRNWHPSLLTFGLFVLWIAFAAFALNSMMQPQPSIQYERVLSWARMPSANHKMFFDRYQCCGYDNISTCNLTAIGKGPGVIQTAQLEAPGVMISGDNMRRLRRRQVDADGGAGGAADPTDGADPAQDGATAAPETPAAPAEPSIPMNGPGVPLPTDGPTQLSPSPLPTSAQPEAVPTRADVKPCQPYVDPLIDAELLRYSKFYVTAAVCSLAQLGFLAGFWTLLGRWKRSRGAGRW